MRLMLDEQELGAIVTAWAREKYRTHNISVSCTLDEHKLLTTVVEITLDTDRFDTVKPPSPDVKFEEVYIDPKGVTIPERIRQRVEDATLVGPSLDTTDIPF
jgi:hypothetical protein